MRASQGYILIRVGPDHHLADVRGYAYEHRLVAEEKLGRRLLPGEQIHHRDGDKANNDPGNLEVVGSVAEHFVHHRSTGSRRRKPNEPNPQILCKCGCGALFLKYDAGGRPRAYVQSGHVPQRAPTRTGILALLSGGALPRADLIRHLGLSKHAVAVALSKLKRRGMIVQEARGKWRLA